MDINTIDSPIYAEVGLGSFRHNLGEVRRLVGKETKIMAVVKADAYGHGAEVLAREASLHGANFFAVARVSEALKLRGAGIESPVLLLGSCSPEHVTMCADSGIRATVNNEAEAVEFSRAAGSAGRRLKVHVKIDTGMGRLGFLHDSLAGQCLETKVCDEIARIDSMPGIEIEGIYSHFAGSDSYDKTGAMQQLDRFKKLRDELSSMLKSRPLFHIANSAAIMELPESHMDMVRPGIILYGVYPSHEVDRKVVHLKPVLSLKSKIIHLKKVGPGFAVSYGSTFVTSAETSVATVPAGYADGYNRLLSSKGEMIVRGMRAPVIGRVCMDLTMINVTGIPEAAVNDDVVLIGSQGSESITAEEIADITGTIGYEVLTSISPRVPRIYTD